MANKKKSSSKKKASKKTSVKKPEDLTPDELTEKAMEEVKEQEPAKEKAVEAEAQPRVGLAKEPMVIVSGKGMGRRKMPMSEYRKWQEKRNAKS
jgi:hypothetical protein